MQTWICSISFSFECYSIPDVVSFSLSPHINWGQSWCGEGGVALTSDFVEYCSTLYCSGHQKRWRSILTGSHRGTPYPLQRTLPCSLDHTQNALCYPHSRWHSQVTTWHNFSRKSYFFFYKLIKQVTNNVFKKREAKGSILMNQYPFYNFPSYFVIFPLLFLLIILSPLLYITLRGTILVYLDVPLSSPSNIQCNSI